MILSLLMKMDYVIVFHKMGGLKSQVNVFQMSVTGDTLDQESILWLFCKSVRWVHLYNEGYSMVWKVLEIRSYLNLNLMRTSIKNNFTWCQYCFLLTYLNSDMFASASFWIPFQWQLYYWNLKNPKSQWYKGSGSNPGYLWQIALQKWF